LLIFTDLNLWRSAKVHVLSFSFITIDKNGRCGAAELFSRMTAQRVDVNVLDGLVMGSMIAVHTASALSGAKYKGAEEHG
jgi:hypothetical protein